tara:strand:+ start:1301 stop:2818 length:1518 start_codon:yes stop_codon:yes gene_type:complete
MALGDSVIVVGGGIAGLTAAALLAHERVPITLLEAHHQTGGCAGTFHRDKYIFDVGATQVAGFEPGGIHDRIFRYLNCTIPKANLLDPACVVDLLDGSQPIKLWHDPKKWEKERIKQFPKTQYFWKFCSFLHQSNWSIASRDPVLPIRNHWDLIQLLKAIRLNNVPPTFFSTISVADLLKICGCWQDKRLRQFLDLQLRLYSQENIENTAALYGATVLHMAQAPIGLWHLDGSMQKLSDQLESCILRDKGKLLLRHRVVRLKFLTKDKLWEVEALDQEGKTLIFQSPDIISSLPPQSLNSLIPENGGMPNRYRKKLENLPKPTGAIVLYGVINRNSLGDKSSSHFQINSRILGSIFISISLDGDGRAPLGKATLIASVFADIDDWSGLNPQDYKLKKKKIFGIILHELNAYFDFAPQDWLHQELSTPRSFLKWTGRPNGIVGGLGQNPYNFGLFGLPSRTPMKGFWLCGDSIYPGEGTAGVSQSALMACKQLIATRGGKALNLPG